MPEGDGRAIEHRDGRIVVTFREVRNGKKISIPGWEQSRENLGLNEYGPDPVEGVEIVSEEERYETDAEEYVFGYTEVTLAFDDESVLKRARDRLLNNATGSPSDIADVREFARRIPARDEVTPDGE